MPAADNVKSLAQLASQCTTAKIIYKKVGEDWHSDRLVEPYSLSHSGDNLIVLTWQLDPELDGAAWRNFRVDRITRVSSGGKLFTPRTPVTLHLGEVSQFIFDRDPEPAAPSKASPAELYFKFVEAALLDAKLTESELQEAKKLSSRLNPQRLKAIHAQIYANLINELCMDGLLSPPEEEMLRNMRLFLGELGWSPGG